jgi:hypothetical protein
MPTQEQLEQRLAELDREWPETLPDRLEWWVRVLDIDRIRLYRLLGLSGAEANRTPLSALSRVVAEHEDQAERLDDMLGSVLASFDYDLPALRADVQRPKGPATPEQQRSTRPPGPVVPLPYTPGPQVRRGLLLNQIIAGGPDALLALRAYLSEPSSGKGGGRKRQD